MNDLAGKKLLVLGGGLAAYNVVKVAKEHGAYVITTDYLAEGKAKEISDESLMISTVDYEKLSEVISDKHIDGVFCGPSEFNIENMINLCTQNNLPVYATKKQWDICRDKATFKDLCRKFDVPCVPDYDLTPDFSEEELNKIAYPVVVKPVDSWSSKGLAICRNEDELKKAYQEALNYSKKKKILVEKYIKNDYAFAVRYIAYKGKVHLLLTNDRYTVNTGVSAISGLAVYPSKLNDYYIKNINQNVISMFESIGLDNCAFFLQALVDPTDNQIYFHEMGLRLSGGLTYPITERVTGINDMLMLLRYAVGNDFSSDTEIEKIDPTLNNSIAVSFCVPLSTGIISKIEGVEDCLNNLDLMDYIQYYEAGSEITGKMIGTLDQHFCRFKFIANSKQDIKDKVSYIQNTLKIIDTNGNDMKYEIFDINRLNNNGDN